MNYGLIIYGPLEDSHAARQKLLTRLYDVFNVTPAQAYAAWDALLERPDFSMAYAHKRQNGDLVLEISDHPAPLDARTFHTRITRRGRSE